MKFKTLKDISRLKVSSQPQKESGKPDKEKKRQTPEREPDEMELFFNAMDDVAPLKSRGRQVPLKKRKRRTAPPRSAREEKVLHDIVQGKIEFEIEYTDEYVQARVHGISRQLFRKLKSGAFSIEGHLDLHGLNIEQAQTALLDFIRASYLLDRRCVLIIPGRGKNSPEGQGVIKQEIQSWMTKDPLRRVILAFCTALPRDGGAGAFYVLLRKAKKTKGKVIWDRLPIDY